MKQIYNRNAFSLVEVMVGLAVSAIVLVSALSIVSIGNKNQTVVMGRGDMDTELANLMYTMLQAGRLCYRGGIDLTSGNVMQVTISYAATPKLLSVATTDLTTHITVTNTYSQDLGGVGSSAYLGFTAGTGTSFATQEIISWKSSIPGAPSFANFNNAFSVLQANGSGQMPTIVSTRLRLTDGIANAAVSVFTKTPVAINSDWNTTFEFQISEDPGSPQMGNGIAFVIQNSAETGLGSNGAGLGYGGNCNGTGGIPKSVAIKFDATNSTTGKYINGIQPSSPAIDLSLGGGGVTVNPGGVKGFSCLVDFNSPPNGKRGLLQFIQKGNQVLYQHCDYANVTAGACASNKWKNWGTFSNIQSLTVCGDIEMANHTCPIVNNTSVRELSSVYTQQIPSQGTCAAPTTAGMGQGAFYRVEVQGQPNSKNGLTTGNYSPKIQGAFYPRNPVPSLNYLVSPSVPALGVTYEWKGMAN